MTYEVTIQATPGTTTALKAPETVEAGRHARFGRLPERIRPEDMVAAQPASVPDPATGAYNEDEWLVRYCL